MFKEKKSSLRSEASQSRIEDSAVVKVAAVIVVGTTKKSLQYRHVSRERVLGSRLGSGQVRRLGNDERMLLVVEKGTREVIMRGFVVREEVLSNIIRWWEMSL